MLLVAELSLWLALLMATWGSVVGLLGAHRHAEPLARSARRAMLITPVLLAIVLAAIWKSLFAPDLSLRLVAASVSAPLAGPYRVAALWATSEGLALTFAFLLSACLAALALLEARQSALASLAGSVLAGVLALTLFWMQILARPLARLDVAPLDGAGMRPVLQQPLMLVHPPAVLLAGAAALTALALAVASLVMRHDASWARRARPWALVAWLAITVALVTVCWWSYVAVPDAMPWASAPVRAGTVFPWLACAGLLHALSSGTAGERRDRWSLGLVVITALLSLLAVYGTAAFLLSGELPFASDALVEALTAALVISTAVAAWRTRSGRTAGAMLVVAGVALLVVIVGASAASGARRATVAVVAPGQPIRVTDALGRSWTLTADGLSTDVTPAYFARGVSIGVLRPSGRRGQVLTEQRQYMDVRGRPLHDPFTRPGILPGVVEDVRVLLLGVVDERREIVRVRVEFAPLVRWLWGAGALLIAGGTLLWWPAAVREEG